MAPKKFEGGRYARGATRNRYADVYISYACRFVGQLIVCQVLHEDDADGADCLLMY